MEPRPRPRPEIRIAVALLVVASAALGACAGQRLSGVRHAGEPPMGFADRASEALRQQGHRVERASGGVVRSRPRAVPSALEPWRSRPGGGGGVQAAATLGELREIATLRAAEAGGVEAEVWLERAHRPGRRLVIRSDGGIFSETTLSSDARGQEQLRAPGEPDAAEARPSEDDRLFSRLAATVAGSPTRSSSGLRWDRWQRLPEAEAALLAAFDASGG